MTPAFNLFRFLTSDTLYLHGRVTLSDKRAGRPCQPVSGQPRGPTPVAAACACRAAPGCRAGEPPPGNAGILGAGLRRYLGDSGAGDWPNLPGAWLVGVRRLGLT